MRPRQGTQPTHVIRLPKLWPLPCAVNSYLSLKTPSSITSLSERSGLSSSIQGNLRSLPVLTFPIFEQQLPDASTGSGVHTSCGLIQDNNLGATHKGNGY